MDRPSLPTAALTLTGAFAGELVVAALDVALDGEDIEVVLTHADRPDDPLLLTGRLADFPVFAALRDAASAHSADVAPRAAAS